MIFLGRNAALATGQKSSAETSFQNSRTSKSFTGTHRNIEDNFDVNIRRYESYISLQNAHENFVDILFIYCLSLVLCIGWSQSGGQMATEFQMYFCFAFLTGNIFFVYCFQWKFYLAVSVATTQIKPLKYHVTVNHYYDYYFSRKFLNLFFLKIFTVIS